MERSFAAGRAMTKMKIELAKEFSRYPMGRYKKDGPKTGEHFREDVLIPALHSSDDIIEIWLDGVIGYGSSFLEETFGGLVRRGFTLQYIKRRIRLISRDAGLLDEIRTYLSEASA